MLVEAAGEIGEARVVRWNEGVAKNHEPGERDSSR
jgi:hypothetical protein